MNPVVRLLCAGLPLACLVLAGCAASNAGPSPLAAMGSLFAAPASQAPPPVAAPPAPPVVTVVPPPAERLVLDYADRIARMSVAERAQEPGKLGDPGNSPVRQMQLAIALGSTGVPSDAARAQSLFRSVSERPGTADNSLAPLARLLSAQLDEQRRADEQIERQAQLLRDAQRRIDQLTGRLEAVRAVERGLTLRRPATAAAPGDSKPPPP